MVVMEFVARVAKAREGEKERERRGEDSKRGGGKVEVEVC